MDSITPYADVNDIQRKILSLLADKMREHGYTPKSAWVRNGNEYEVYSLEMSEKDKGIVAAYAYIDHESNGEVVTPSGVEQIALCSTKDGYNIERKGYKGIIQYKEASKEDQEVLRALGKEVRKHGYTAGRGWVRDGKEYEVYSKELVAHAKERGAVACSCIVSEKGTGYITTEAATIKIRVERENGEVIVREDERSRQSRGKASKERDGR